MLGLVDEHLNSVNKVMDIGMSGWIGAGMDANEYMGTGMEGWVHAQMATC